MPNISYPYICFCGYNTMCADKAYQHAAKHVQYSTTFHKNAMERAQGRRVLICPNGYAFDDGTIFDTHHRPFYVTDAELQDAGGYIVCEFCEARCVEIARQESEFYILDLDGNYVMNVRVMGTHNQDVCNALVSLGENPLLYTWRLKEE